MNNKFKDTLHLTGLRAYAALSVFFIHSNGLGLRSFFSNEYFNFAANKIIDFSKYGVILFFLLSAYTLSMSLDKKINFNFIPYLKRRLLRVLPMYYVAILFSFIFSQFFNIDLYNKTSPDILNLFHHVALTNLFKFEYRNNLLGVEWSIPIEIFYYLFIPTLFFNIKKSQKFTITILLISLIIISSRSQWLGFDFSEHKSTNYYEWSAAKYFFTFVLGIVLYTIVQRYKSLITKISTIYFIPLFFISFLYILSDIKNDVFFVSLICALIIVFIESKRETCRAIFENKPILELGNISYSFYLVHYFIISCTEKVIFNQTLSGFFSLLISLIISRFCYLFIEKRFYY